MITILTVIIIVSILMTLKGKEMLLVGAIFLFCYSFPLLAVIVVTLAVLAHYSN